MKKWFILLLAALLLLAVACKTPEGAPAQDPSAQAPQDDTGKQDDTTEPETTRPPKPEEPEYKPLPDELKPLAERIAGEWFADVAGLTVPLTLLDDGSYTLTLPGEAPKTGAWEAKDGVIVLDGDEENPLTPLGDALIWDAAELLFTREMPLAYVPAEVIADAKEGAFDGFFKAQFVAVGEGTILAAAAEEDAFVYIEGTNVALGGARFGNVIKVFAAAPGALTLDEDGFNVKLELQQDGFLRMTLSDAVIWLMPAVIPGTEPGE